MKLVNFNLEEALAQPERVVCFGGKVAFYSMEMQHQQVSARLLAMKSKVSSSSILYGKLNKEELSKFDKAAGYRDWETDRKSTRLNSSHSAKSRMPSSA